MHKNAVPADVTAATTSEPDFVVLGTVDVERGPIADLAVSADGRTVVATHYGNGNVSVIDAYAMTVEADIEMPVEPLLVTTSATARLRDDRGPPLRLGRRHRHREQAGYRQPSGRGHRDRCCGHTGRHTHLRRGGSDPSALASR